MANLFERPDQGERALLVHIDLPQQTDGDVVTEFKELVHSTGGQIVGLVTGKRTAPEAKYFIGSGKAEEVRERAVLEEADLVIFNHALSPAQERNLEHLFQRRVLDRTGLILDIFSRRARSFEGKLQVELAQLRHLSTRLVRGWEHLERQKGGIGLRGPGETQLETDRRLLRGRIKTISKQLEKVHQQRDLSRRSRRRAAIPSVSLVGYTNAGKSTLFNQLTHADAYVADQLFATLDPTLRRIKLPGIAAAVVADTVGFISRLPHDLIYAFHATLEEAVEADLLLHVVDAHDPRKQTLINDVHHVLLEIGAHEVPMLQVYNKIDLLPSLSPRIDRNEAGRPERVWLSAATGEGLDLLKQVMVELLLEDPVSCELVLQTHEGKLHAALHAAGGVISEETVPEGGWKMRLCLPRQEYERLVGGSRCKKRDKKS